MKDKYSLVIIGQGGSVKFMNNKKYWFLKVLIVLLLISNVNAQNLIKDGNMEELPLEDVSVWETFPTTLVEKVKVGSNTVLHVINQEVNASDTHKTKQAGVKQSLGNIERPISLKISFRYKVIKGKGFGAAVGIGKFENAKWGLEATEWEKFEHVFDLGVYEEKHMKNTMIYFIQKLQYPTEFYLDDVSVEVVAK